MATSTKSQVRTDGSRPELYDLWIDAQYANLGCDDTDYAREPWKHCRDAPNTFLGLREKKRDEFMAQIDERRRKRVEHEIDRIGQTRKNFGSYNNKKDLITRMSNARKEWKKAVVYNLNNFKNETKEKYEGQPDKADLLQRDMELLSRLESWRRDTETSKDRPHCSKTQRRPSLIDLMKNRGRHDEQRRPTLPHTISEQVHEDDEPDEPAVPEPMYGFKACAMYFKKLDSNWIGYNYRHEKYSGHFPNQKIAMNDILNTSENNPLSEPCPEDSIRYFHFPTNNMSWIETAISRYYGEEPAEIDDHKHFTRMTRKTEKLLAREFWRGQMHGTGGRGIRAEKTVENNVRISTQAIKDDARRTGPVHARHMRSRCSIIPREPQTKPSPPSDLPSKSGLPSRTNTQSSLSAKPRPEKNIALFLPYLHWETSNRRAKMFQVVKEATTGEQKVEKGHMPNVVTTVVKKQKPDYQPTCRNRLGEYLMALAQMADEMDYEADERLLRDNVNKNPPLHIRRTLDQYYFLTLDNTSNRDKDQVVYRGTRAGKSFHTRNTRVVMVDQLWLWILDDNTIITSFPRRWGRNKPDPSGVHKSLRERLETKTDSIKSVYHLALIIIDQCSQVFFDRTKPLDQRPEVMDLFASAIGNVTELTAIAYENFWRHTKILAKNWMPAGSEVTHHRYLDINPEGTLLQEAQDIAEELKIMGRIYTEQRKVVKDFKRQLAHPQGKRSNNDRNETVMVQKLIDALEKRSSKDGSADAADQAPGKIAAYDADTIHEAEVLMELIDSRQAEIQDLEDSALRTCQQIEGLLSLKQQQATIVEAKAALRRADESIKQGRSIMAFTIVTIIFAPLGFFAAFFGMNNRDITGDTWMSLSKQIQYMFGLSAIVIVLSVSMALSAWARAVMKVAFRAPLTLMAEYTGLHKLYMKSPIYHVNLERRSRKIFEHVSKRQRESEDKNKDANDVFEVPGKTSQLPHKPTIVPGQTQTRMTHRNAMRIEQDGAVASVSSASNDTIYLRRLFHFWPTRKASHQGIV